MSVIHSMQRPLAQSFYYDGILAAPGVGINTILTEGADVAASIATTYSMDVGDSIDGTLASPTSADGVQVSLTADKTDTISMNSTALYDYLYLRDAAGNEITHDGDVAAATRRSPSRQRSPVRPICTPTSLAAAPVLTRFRCRRRCRRSGPPPKWSINCPVAAARCMASKGPILPILSPPPQ